MTFIDIIIGLLIVLTLFIVITVISHIWVPVPFVPTPKDVVKRMITLADLKGAETVYDLGAGDGRFLIEAKKIHPELNVIGVEYLPTIWLLGKMRILFSGLRIPFHLRNALFEDLHDADCIFLYVIPEIMDRMEQKFHRELKPGTKVISYVFEFKNRKPVAEEEVPWLSGKRKVRVYEW